MNSPFLNTAGWTPEVTKMIRAIGAPIGDEDARQSSNIWRRITAPEPTLSAPRDGRAAFLIPSRFDTMPWRPSLQALGDDRAVVLAMLVQDDLRRCPA
jgi:hypothetical protein